ncbi:PAS domain-containing sensor histidine kinase [Pseudoxanthomonas daejeonensis]|uniref:histidine kinase n=1 Tax=Pseudoxanthomonas daejeonensis TaxID=266062 RepID=A0ABQ6Z777_9GAMM|nr:PAS domain-containing sensor histidine kinase [Pseudoxanthomonas daejeonensis]KAF1694093.1 PAS domain-containing sensor histidine kinase [Pseudoxanthomonas daejeonensis]
MAASSFPFNAEALLVQSLTDYAIYMLDPEGHILSWNPGGQRIKGYTDAEVIGHHFSQFYTEDDVRRGEPQRGLATARSEGRFEAEGWRVRKDGSQFRANIVIDPIWQDGELMGFVKVTKDVTERFKAQTRLQEAERTLAQSQKIHAIGQLTLGIAHDFNNVLAVVTASLDLIARTSSEERRQQLVDAAQKAAHRGSMLSRQMLAFARGQNLSPANLDVNELIRASIEVYRRAAGAIATCTLDLVDGDPVAYVDGARFEAALMNLVANARDAMTAQGSIVIATRVVQPADGVHPDLQPGRRYLYITVTDDGPGMGEEVRLRAMEPFFTTKDVGRGSGLGLSQVFGFASQSGGFASIHSEPGAGTRVTIAVPVVE